MSDPISPDDLKARLAEPGWQHTSASGESQTGTLAEMASRAHAAREDHPGTISKIENAVELELLQLQELWHHLGLPE